MGCLHVWAGSRSEPLPAKPTLPPGAPVLVAGTINHLVPQTWESSPPSPKSGQFYPPNSIHIWPCLSSSSCHEPDPNPNTLHLDPQATACGPNSYYLPLYRESLPTPAPDRGNVMLTGLSYPVHPPHLCSTFI